MITFFHKTSILTKHSFSPRLHLVLNLLFRLLHICILYIQSENIVHYFLNYIGSLFFTKLQDSCIYIYNITKNDSNAFTERHLMPHLVRTSDNQKTNLYICMHIYIRDWIYRRKRVLSTSALQTHTKRRLTVQIKLNTILYIQHY